MHSFITDICGKFEHINYDKVKGEIYKTIDHKIDRTIDYYSVKRQSLLDFINNRDNITPDQIIESGVEMAILESKLTALEIAKEN